VESGSFGEAWPSPATGTELTEGVLDTTTSLYVLDESDQLVLFGDGIEDDFLAAPCGSAFSCPKAGQAQARPLEVQVAKRIGEWLLGKCRLDKLRPKQIEKRIVSLKSRHNLAKLHQNHLLVTEGRSIFRNRRLVKA